MPNYESQSQSSIEIPNILSSLNDIQNGSIFNTFTPYLTPLGNLAYKPASHQLFSYDHIKQRRGVTLTMLPPPPHPDGVDPFQQLLDTTLLPSIAPTDTVADHPVEIVKSRSASSLASSHSASPSSSHLRSSSVVIPTKILPHLIELYQTHYPDNVLYGKAIPALCGSISSLAASITSSVSIPSPLTSQSQEHLLEHACDELISTNIVNKLHMVTSSFATVSLNPSALVLNPTAIQDLLNVVDHASALQFLETWGSHFYTGEIELGLRWIRHGSCPVPSSIHASVAYHAISQRMSSADHAVIQYLASQKIAMLCGFIALDPVNNGAQSVTDGDVAQQMETLMPTIDLSLSASIPEGILPLPISQPHVPDRYDPQQSQQQTRHRAGSQKDHNSDKDEKGLSIYNYLIKARQVDPVYWVITHRSFKRQHMLPIWEVLPTYPECVAGTGVTSQHFQLLEQAYNTIKTSPSRQQISSNTLRLLKSFYERFLYGQFTHAYGFFLPRLHGREDLHMAKQLYYSIHLQRALGALKKGDFAYVIKYLRFIHHKVEMNDFVIVQRQEVAPVITSTSSTLSIPASPQSKTFTMSPPASSRPLGRTLPPPGSSSPTTATAVGLEPSRSSFTLGTGGSLAERSPSGSFGKCYIDIPLINPYIFYDEIFRLPDAMKREVLLPLAYFMAYDPVLSSDVKKYFPPYYHHLFSGEFVYIRDTDNSYYLSFERDQVYSRKWRYSHSNPEDANAIRSFQWKFRCCNELGEFIDTPAIAQGILQRYDVNSHISPANFDGYTPVRPNAFADQPSPLLSCGVHFRMINHQSTCDMQVYTTKNRDALVYARPEAPPQANDTSQHNLLSNLPDVVPQVILNILQPKNTNEEPEQPNTIPLHKRSTCIWSVEAPISPTNPTNKTKDPTPLVNLLHFKVQATQNYLKVEQGRWKQMYVHGGGTVLQSDRDRFLFEVLDAPRI